MAVGSNEWLGLPALTIGRSTVLNKREPELLQIKSQDLDFASELGELFTRNVLEVRADAVSLFRGGFDARDARCVIAGTPKRMGDLVSLFLDFGSSPNQFTELLEVFVFAVSLDVEADTERAKSLERNLCCNYLAQALARTEQGLRESLQAILKKSKRDGDVPDVLQVFVRDWVLKGHRNCSLEP